MRIKHLRNKYFLFITVLTIGIIVILGAISITIFSNAMLKEVKTIADQKIQIISSDLEEELKYVFSLSERVLNNQELESKLLLDNDSDESMYEKMRAISEITRAYAYADVGINSIFFMDKYHQIYDPFYMISPYKEIIDQYKAYGDFKMSGAYSAFSLPTNFPSKFDTEPGNKSTITFFEKYLSKDDYQEMGTILTNVKIDYLFMTFRNACKAEFHSAYVVDSESNIIYKVEDDGSEDVISENKIIKLNNQNGIVNINEKDYYYIKKGLDIYPDWQIIGIMEYNHLKTGINAILKYYYVIGFLSVIVIIIASFAFAKRITKPILSLKESMDVLATGEWPEPLVPTTHDEIRSLIEGYNNMLAEQQKLIEQIYLEQEDKKKKELETIELKLDLLHSQINPHFIHNTLHTMQYLLKINKTEGLLEILTSFNRLLRFNMSIDKTFITLKEEQLCIDSYIKILEYRYNKVFDISYQLDESCSQFMIPKLILQPLVENAIYHGIIPKKSDGSVIISMTLDRTFLKIKVEDNGVGIETERIKNILLNKEEGNSSSFNQIGIHNIDKRLRLIYGDEAGLKIMSALGEGTMICFNLPVEQLEREH